MSGLPLPSMAHMRAMKTTEVSGPRIALAQLGANFRQLSPERTQPLELVGENSVMSHRLSKETELATVNVGSYEMSQWIEDLHPKMRQAMLEIARSMPEEQAVVKLMSNLALSESHAREGVAWAMAEFNKPIERVKRSSQGRGLKMFNHLLNNSASSTVDLNVCCKQAQPTRSQHNPLSQAEQLVGTAVTLGPGDEPFDDPPQAQVQAELLGKRMKGVVKWFCDQRGYGFVGTIPSEHDDPAEFMQQDYFVHHSAIESAVGSWKTLQETEEVEFELIYDEENARYKAFKVKCPGSDLAIGKSGSSSKLQRGPTKVCWGWNQGRCYRGKRCKFVHDMRALENATVYPENHPMLLKARRGASRSAQTRYSALSSAVYHYKCTCHHKPCTCHHK